MSTPKGSEMTHPRSQSQLMANHGHSNNHCNNSRWSWSTSYTVQTLCQVLYTSRIFTSLFRLQLQDPLGKPSLTPLGDEAAPGHLPLSTPFPTSSSWGHSAPSEMLLGLLHIQPVTKSSSWPVSVGPRKLRMVATILKSCL